MKGGIFELRPRKNARGYEQQGKRYGVVALASRYQHMSLWVTIPTSTSARPYIFRPEIEIPDLGPTLALCDGMLAVDPQERLGSQVGHLSLREMQAVDTAITELLDLS
jgi:mRNA interferase MazF